MKKALLALVAAMAAVTGAQADITTASGAIPLTDTDFTLALPMGAFSPVIPATAVVNSADITLSGEFLSTLTALNTSTSSNNVFSRTSTLNLDLLFGGSSLMSLAMDIWAVPQTTLGPSGSTNPPAFRDFGTSADSDSLTLTFTDAALLSALKAGTANFMCDAFVNSAGRDGGGNVRVVQETQAGCGISVAVNFTPATATVPEPTSLALVGLALAGAGFASRRRKA